MEVGTDGRALGRPTAPDGQAAVRSLLDAMVTLGADLPLDAVLSRIVAVATELVNARYAALGVVGSGPDRLLRTFVHHGIDAQVIEQIGAWPEGHGVLGVLIDDPRPLRLSDIKSHPEAHGFPQHHPVMGSFLGAPVGIRERTVGSLYLAEKAGGGDFTDEDESVVVALAAVAGVVVENARLSEEAARLERWLTATAQINTLLVHDSAAQEALQAVADQAREVSGADASWIAVGPDADRLEVRVLSGVPIELSAVGPLPMERSLASLVARTGEALSVDDLSTDPRAINFMGFPGWPRLGPAIVVPLGSGAGHAGALTLAWMPERAESFHDLAPGLPASFAEHAALALQVAEARDAQLRLALLEEGELIAHDLHDQVIQRLFALGLALQVAGELAVASEVRARIAAAVEELDAAVTDIRRTIFAIGGRGSADVQTEVERIVDGAAATLKFRPSLRFDGPVRSTVGDTVAPDLLAVLNEALANTRHAQASRVDVVVAVGDQISVRVSDDGVGLDDAVIESGLSDMRERALEHGGTFTVSSSPGGGTTVTWSVPLGSRRAG